MSYIKRISRPEQCFVFKGKRILTWPLVLYSSYIFSQVCTAALHKCTVNKDAI